MTPSDTLLGMWGWRYAEEAVIAVKDFLLMLLVRIGMRDVVFALIVIAVAVGLILVPLRGPSLNGELRLGVGSSDTVRRIQNPDRKRLHSRN